MNPVVEPHEPTPEFRAHLEWQIASALRRQSRFAAPVTTRLQQLRTALVVLAALALGGAAGVASGQIQDARQRDVLTEASRSEEQLLRVRLDLSRQEYQRARERFDVGPADHETLLAAERDLRAMETALARVRLDLEEIKATSAAPRNDLQAPLVGQRDFVRERLTLDLQQAQRQLTAAEQSRTRADQNMNIGVASPAVLLQAEAEVARARTHLRMVQAALDLRQRVLAGEIGAEQVAATQRRTELTLQREQVQREVDLARGRVDEVRRLVSVGMATELELKRTEIKVLELQLELQRMQQELVKLGAVR
jgi:outer membrane protein TolC